MPPNKPPKREKPITAAERPPLSLIAPAQENPWYKILFFGHTKVGKSHLAGDTQNVEGMSPTLVLGFGEGVATYIGEPRFAGLQVVKPGSLDEIEKFYDWLRPDWDQDGTGQNGLVNYGWRTVVLDDLDRLYDMLMQERMREVVAAKEHRERDKPALDDYGVVRNRLLRIIDWHLALPAHVILTCWADKSTDASDGRIKLMPSLPGKLANDIAGRVGIVSYLEFSLPRRRKQNSEDDPNGMRLAHFAGSNSFISGVWGESRIQRLGAEIENPTMQEIYRRLQGE